MKSSIASIVLLLFIFNITLSSAYFSVIKFDRALEADYLGGDSAPAASDNLEATMEKSNNVQAALPEIKSGAEEIKVKKIIKKTITAYSSSPDETDSTPFITARNTRVRDGIVAANSLAFGVKIMIPEIFGEKIFVVEDRMHQRYGNRIDIWMPSKKMALEFGKKFAEVHIIDM